MRAQPRQLVEVLVSVLFGDVFQDVQGDDQIKAIPGEGLASRLAGQVIRVVTLADVGGQ